MQRVLRECLGLLEAHAAVAERAPTARKQRVGGRVVQVHVERIREEELHMTQRIPGTRTLAEE